MVSRSRSFLHWLMEKPYGAYLIIIFARIFIVLVLWRCYIYSFPLFQIIFNYRSVSICFILIIWSQDSQKAGGRESIMSAIDYPDAVHNFIFSQKLTTLLGNFPEVSFHSFFNINILSISTCFQDSMKYVVFYPKCCAMAPLIKVKMEITQQVHTQITHEFMCFGKMLMSTNGDKEKFLLKVERLLTMGHKSSFKKPKSKIHPRLSLTNSISPQQEENFS